MGNKTRLDKGLIKILSNGLNERPPEIETPDRAESNNQCSITGRGFISPPSPPVGRSIQDLSLYERETKGV